MPFSKYCARDYWTFLDTGNNGRTDRGDYGIQWVFGHTSNPLTRIGGEKRRKKEHTKIYQQGVS